MDLSERSVDSFERPELSESGMMTQMEHFRSQSMTDVPIPQEKEKSKKFSSRVGRGIKKAIKGGGGGGSDSKKTRSLSPPQSRQQQPILSHDDENADSLNLTPKEGEPKKKHKSKFKPVAKAAAAAARKIGGHKSKSSNRDRTLSEGSSNPSLPGVDPSNSRSSTPTNVQQQQQQQQQQLAASGTGTNYSLPLGKTPVNTPVNATAILDLPIPEELMEECSTHLANMGKHSMDHSESAVEPFDSSTTAAAAQEMSMEFVPSLMDDTFPYNANAHSSSSSTSAGMAMAAPVASTPSSAAGGEGTEAVMSAEDEAIKLAEAMALAVKDNPNMTHEEIRKLVLSQPQFQNSPMAAAGGSSSSGGSGKSTKTLLKKNFMNFQEKFTSGTHTARDKFKEMMGSTNLDLGGSVTSFVYSKAPPKQEQDGTIPSAAGAGTATESASDTTTVPTTATTNAAAGTLPSDPSAAKATSGAGAGTGTAMDASHSSTSAGVASMQNSSASVSLPSVATSEQETKKMSDRNIPTPTAPPITTPPSVLAEKPAAAAAAAPVPAPIPEKAPAAAAAAVAPPLARAVSSEKAFSASPTRAAATVATINKLEPPIRLTDIVWKRRSGLGKYSTSSAWERRRMVLRGSKLLYYRAKGEGSFEDDSTGAGALEGDLLTPHQQQQQQMTNTSERMEGTGKNAKSSTGRSMMDALERASNSLGLSSQNAPLSSATKADARGYMDLVKEGATVSATTGHSGAPSPFCLSIKVRGETKWKLCFASHKTQMEWLAALTDVAVQASVDAYNVELLSAADPGNPGMASALYHNQVFEPSSDGEGGVKAAKLSAAQVVPEMDNTLPQPKLQSSGHRLWMMEPYNIRGQTELDADDDSSTTSIDSGTDESDVPIDDFPISEDVAEGTDGDMDASGMSIAEDVGKSWVLPEKNFMKAATLVNAAILYARNSSMSVQAFWTGVVIANMCLFVCLEGIQTPGAQESKTGGGRLSKLTRRSRGIPRKKGRKGGAGGVADGSGSGADIKGEAIVSKGKKDSFIPTAGMSTLKIENPHDLATNSKGQVFAGWRAPTGEAIHVRSHGYMETKAKIPSPGTLFELTQMDVFESPSRYPDMAPRVKLPKLAYEVDPNELKTWKTPDYFVVSVALPTDPPKLAKTSSDGGGYTLTMYFTMKKETRDILKRVTAENYNPAEEPTPEDRNKSIVNAVRLLEEWCRRAPNDLAFQTRFKMIPYVENAKEIGLPSWIGKYNAKPLLIKRPGQTGFLFTHPELSCIEFDISLHVFPYLAKQGICYLKDSMFKKILASVAFVIEGRDDDELPECLIGIVQICYPDPSVAIQASEFFAGTAPRSFDPSYGVGPPNKKSPDVAQPEVDSDEPQTATQTVGAS